MFQSRTQSVLGQLWSRTSRVPLVSPCQETSASPSLQGAFDQRMKTWQRWQDAQTMLQKKREMEARLLWANKPDKLQQAKDEISEVGNGAWGLCSVPALHAPVGDLLGWGRNLLGWGTPPKQEGQLSGQAAARAKPALSEAAGGAARGPACCDLCVRVVTRAGRTELCSSSTSHVYSCGSRPPRRGDQEFLLLPPNSALPVSAVGVPGDTVRKGF